MPSGEVVMGLFTDGMVLAPAQSDCDYVRGLLVEALAIVTPVVDRGVFKVDISVIPATSPRLRVVDADRGQQ